MNKIGFCTKHLCSFHMWSPKNQKLNKNTVYKIYRHLTSSTKLASKIKTSLKPYPLKTKVCKAVQEAPKMGLLISKSQSLFYNHPPIKIKLNLQGFSPSSLHVSKLIVIIKSLLNNLSNPFQQNLLKTCQLLGN